MTNKRGGLGRGLNEIFDDQAKAEASNRGRTDGLDVLIPSQSQIAARDAAIQTPVASPFEIPFSDGSAAESPDQLRKGRWDEIDPAPTRDLGRNRAQRAYYSYSRFILVIVMRDGSWIRYDGVQPNDWLTLKNRSISTNDYIQYNLHGHPWTKTDDGILNT